MRRKLVLIATNFAREQRWPILVLLLWVLVMSVLGLTVDLRTDRDDLLVIFKQLAVYGIAFAVFVGGSAIHNERKTRRILAVLSKAVGRGEYISGLLIGIAFVLLLYCFCMGLTGTWVLGPGGFSLSLLWFLMLSVFIACVLASAVAVMFATFLPPLFATLATAVVLAVPVAAALQLSQRWGYLVPMYPLLAPFLQANFIAQERPEWSSLALAVAETAVLWVLAWRVFDRRDVALALD